MTDKKDPTNAARQATFRAKKKDTTDKLGKLVDRLEAVVKKVEQLKNSQ